MTAHRLLFPILLFILAFARADEPKPDQAAKLWESKPPGDFTVPGPETITPPKPADALPILRIFRGGQVALIATTNAEQRLYPPLDAIDQVSCRPDLLMLCYPWKILADNSTAELKPEVKIDAKTPPTFIAQANDDKSSLAEGSTLAFLALRKAGVPAELHIYSTGGHGFGLRPNNTQAPGDWPGRLDLWLKAHAWLAP
jgi:hypothetical protein